MKEDNMTVSSQTKDKFKAYIDSHTGKELAEKKPREKIDTLAKATTAYMLMESGAKRYNENVIHRKAEKIKQTLDLDDLHEVEINAMLSSPAKLKKGVNHQLNTLYAPNDNIKDYVKKMKVLAENMPMEDNRSAQYNTMANCIKEVSEIDPAKTSRDRIIVKNYKLMQSIERNIQGKERVRRTNSGMECFNTALDALAIMNDHNPALNDKTNSIVDKINYTRGSERSNHKDHIDIKEFGAARSVEAKKARVQRAKERRLERTLDKDKLKKKQMERPTLGM
ncbi:hypothetical protein SAMN06297422_11541 [Lachnospiraceae bacterium]|nr:hypothetical protein SAMN06297422_11541 [Lachnospiraceae bacterium]